MTSPQQPDPQQQPPQQPVTHHPAPVPAPPPQSPFTPATPVPAPPHMPPPQPPLPGMPPVPTPGTGAVNEHGYPENTPVTSMTAEQQAAYWRLYARRNEDRVKQMGDYAQLKEQAEAYQKYLQDSQTEQQKAVAEAEARGRKAALAEAGGHMVEAYVRASAAGRMSGEQVDTLLQGLDRTRFVNPSTGQVDAAMVQSYIAMLAPAPAAPLYPVMPGAQAPGVAQTYNPNQPVTYPPATTVAWGYPPQQVPGQPLPAQPDMGAQRQVPNYGQAQFPAPQPRGLEAGRAAARARFGKPAPPPQQ